MMAFTVTAAILVWRTLIATQKIATDTRVIGKAQIMAHLIPKSISLALYESNEGAEGIRWIIIKFAAKNVGSTPAYRVSAKGIVKGNKAKPEWVAATPRDAAPNDSCEIKFHCDIRTTPQTGKDEILGIYLRFDSVFTRGKDTKFERIRFDYRIVSYPNGKAMAIRI